MSDKKDDSNVITVRVPNPARYAESPLFCAALGMAKAMNGKEPDDDTDRK